MSDDMKFHSSLYVTLCKQARPSATNTVSRALAIKLINKLGNLLTGDVNLQRWVNIVNDTSVRWGAVTEVDVTGVNETGYDLTVPGFETFTAVDGVILSNTVGVHVPVTEGARLEAINTLMASKSLINPRSGDVEPLPNVDAKLGVWKMTTPVGEATKSFPSGDAVIRAYNRKEIAVNEAIKVNGGIHTAGQFLVTELIPPGITKELKPLTSKDQDKILLEATKKLSSDAAADLINKFKNIGFKHITDLGFSVSLNDLKVDKKKRDEIFKKMDADVKVRGFAAAAGDASKELDKLLTTNTGNSLVQATYLSGASGKSSSVRQMIGAPVAVAGAKGEVVPFAIRESYAEGHDSGSYFASIGGSRQGLIDKGLTVADSGYLSRLLVSSNLENTITEDDCKTTQGISLPIDSPELHDRYGAEGAYRNILLTPDVVQRARTSGMATIKVRSPLTCQSASGLCAMCFGTLENNKKPQIGYHVGAMAAQSLGERSTQITLKNFHSGSAVGSGGSVGLTRLKDLLHNTDVARGNAVLAAESGTVSAITPAPTGGVFVQVNKEKHFIPRELGNAVTVGQHVNKGDKLSTYGNVRPRDVLETTGDIRKTQDVLIEELKGAYGGAKFKRKILETAVKPMTDRAQITDAGDGDREYGVHPGEVYVRAKLEDYNDKLKLRGLKPIVFTPILLGITQIPHHSEDVIASLAHERIKENLQKAPALNKEINFGPKGHILARLGLKHFDSIDRLKRGG